MSHHPIHKHMHTHITKGNVKAAIRDDKAHMTYLKEDVDKDQKYGGKYKDENQTADEKHISKLAGDVKHDEGVSRKSSSPLDARPTVKPKENPAEVATKRADEEKYIPELDHGAVSRKSSSPLDETIAQKDYNLDEYNPSDDHDSSPVNFMGIKRPGRCTPFPNPDCEPGTPQYNLAKRLKPGGDLYKGKKK